MRWFKKRNLSGDNFIDPDEILADSVALSKSSYLHEDKLELSIGKLPALFFLLSMGIGMIYLGGRGFYLQIIRGDFFLSQAEQNRFLVRRITAPRGIIYDRYGSALVKNIPTFDVISAKDKTILEKALSPEEILPRLPQINSSSELEVRESLRRVYTNPYALSHVLGFTGIVSKDDLEQNPSLRHGDIIGKRGLELFYNKFLTGKNGAKIIETDSSGKETRFKLIKPPQEGSSLKLNLDSALQKAVYDIIKNYTQGKKAAAAVLLDPQNGAVRALVSFPGFDINRFGYSLSGEEFNAILQNPLKPLFNRAISGEYPSGSTIKPLIAAAALEEQLIDPSQKIYDEGFISIPNPYQPGKQSIFLDWKKHGWINFYDAIAHSANVYFYMIGGGYQNQKGLGIQRIQHYAQSFLLGSKLGIDLAGEKPGLIPGPEWKEKNEPSDPIWRVGDTYNVSIGQGGVKVTPLQIASLVAAIANGGNIYKPRLVAEIINPQGKVIKSFPPQIIGRGDVSEKVLREVIRGMRLTVTAGTAKYLASLPVSVAAKTGTAQTGNNMPPHAWLAAFAPVENPEIAIAVLVEHGGEGTTTAVPIAYEILKWYFTHRGA